jgi:hypothetical protein
MTNLQKEFTKEVEEFNNLAVAKGGLVSKDVTFTFIIHILVLIGKAIILKEK